MQHRATDRIINVGTFTQGQEQFLDYYRESVLLHCNLATRVPLDHF